MCRTRAVWLPPRSRCGRCVVPQQALLSDFSFTTSPDPRRTPPLPSVTTNSFCLFLACSGHLLSMDLYTVCGILWLASFRLSLTCRSISTSLFLMAAWYSVLWVCCTLFIHSSLGRPQVVSASSPLWAMVLWTALRRVCVDTCSVLRGERLRDLLDPTQAQGWAFWGAAGLFARAAALRCLFKWTSFLFYFLLWVLNCYFKVNAYLYIFSLILFF